jgi:hypothetical protein
VVAVSVVTLNSVSAGNYPGAPSDLREWALLEAPLHVGDNVVQVRRALRLRRMTTPEATVAVVWAGALPYHVDRKAIDLLGKNDRVIAHLTMRRALATASMYERLTFFYPGHLKYDYGYSIGRLRPDVWQTPVWPHPEEAYPYLDDYARIVVGTDTLYMRQGASSVRWDRLAALPEVRATGGSISAAEGTRQTPRRSSK